MRARMLDNAYPTMLAILALGISMVLGAPTFLSSYPSLVQTFVVAGMEFIIVGVGGSLMISFLSSRHENKFKKKYHLK